MCVFARGVCADAFYEKIGVFETIPTACLNGYCEAVIDNSEAAYLHTDTKKDAIRALYRSKKRPLPEMLDRPDCNRWECPNCPVSFHGKHKRKEKTSPLSLKAIPN